MNSQDQIIEIAKLDGWEVLTQGPTNRDYKFRHTDGRWVRTYKDLPRYLHSRDAIIPVIEKQPEKVKRYIARYVFVLQGCDLNKSLTDEEVWYLLLTASPSQLCEALLRATGKWKD